MSKFKVQRKSKAQSGKGIVLGVFIEKEMFDI
jgi:hypothetical protein